MSATRGKSWSTEEDQRLAQLWQLWPGRSVEARARLAAPLLGRSFDAVTHRARRLGLPGMPSYACPGCSRLVRSQQPLTEVCRACRRALLQASRDCPSRWQSRRPRCPDPEPCPHPPGSEGKILWLMRRVEHGYYLWHPDDAH